VGNATLAVSLGRESRQILDNAQGTPPWFLMANDEGYGYAKKNQGFLFLAEVMFMKKYLLEQTENEKAGD
jgi:hypothetical protein